MTSDSIGALIAFCAWFWFTRRICWKFVRLCFDPYLEKPHSLFGDIGRKR